MVANNFCGFSSRATTLFSFFDLDSPALFKSACDNEKNATSEPDTKAERTNRTNIDVPAKSSQ